MNVRQTFMITFKICYVPLILCDFLLRAWLFLFRKKINSFLCYYALLGK